MNTRRLYCSVVAVDVRCAHVPFRVVSTKHSPKYGLDRAIHRTKIRDTAHVHIMSTQPKICFWHAKKIMPRSPLKWKGPIPNSTLVLQVIFISYFFSSHGPRPTSTSPPLARAASPLSWAPSFPATRDASHQGCGRVGGAALALIVRTTQRRLSVLPSW
jgi:hypothetical protein